MVNTTEYQITDCYCDNCVMCRTLITQFYCTESLPVNPIPDRKADLSGDQLDIEEYINMTDVYADPVDTDEELTNEDIDSDNADTEVTDRSMDDEEDAE